MWIQKNIEIYYTYKYVLFYSKLYMVFFYYNVQVSRFEKKKYGHVSLDSKFTMEIKYIYSLSMEIFWFQVLH